MAFHAAMAKLSAMTTIISDNEACPCCSGLSYSNCCEPYHSGARHAPTAEILMRSRFTAYALDNADYLLGSWDATTRPAALDLSRDHAEWHKLLIINSKKGGAQDNKGSVEFKAFYTQDAGEFFLHENSRFVKTRGQWFYLDGQIKAAGKAVNETGIGRNEACPCGSGRKFKHCCGR